MSFHLRESKFTKKILFCFAAICLPLFFVVYTCYSQTSSVTPATAMQSYLHNGDQTYHWQLKDTFSIGTVKGYDLLLTSQHWRRYTWTHQLTILVPAKNKYDCALLFITSGHNKKNDGLPEWHEPADMLTKRLSKIASENSTTAAIIRQVPNEPLFGGLTEDQIISYTFHKFEEDFEKGNDKDKEYTWPLLFPMVKSAVRGMDAVQDFSRKNLHHRIKHFLVSGASKRGWTTWLTAAADPRVEAIVPMAIDVLNMPVNLIHQLKAYGKYSSEIKDFVKLGIVQSLETPEGKALVKMVDPYSYRKKLTMPKMIMVGSNDPYWVIDNAKNYLPGIPGINSMHYIANAGHLIENGQEAYTTLSAFLGVTLKNCKYPICSWNIIENGREATLIIKASKDILKDAVLWQADSKGKDFRNDKWYSKDLGISHQSIIKIVEKIPSSGYRAFYVDLKYPDPNGGEYFVSTRAFMSDTNHVYR
jgi:PhoPQ-activated pathogenicity-related protein